MSNNGVSTSSLEWVRDGMPYVTTSDSIRYFLSIGSTALILGTLLTLTCQVETAGLPIQSMLISKKSSLANEESFTNDGTEDLEGARYDEYPVVVPKRAALIIDRILKEIESAKDNTRLENDWSSQITRRGNKEKIYFRCYFNAVSCYKKK